MLWQYRTMLFEFTKDGLLGDKYVDDEEMEKTLNQLGGKGWELVNVTLLQDGVLAFLKKPAQEERILEAPVVTVAPDPQSVAPTVQPRSAAPPRINVPAPSLEPRLEPEPEPLPQPTFAPEPEPSLESQLGPALHAPRKSGGREDVSDFVGGIRIS